MLVYLDHNATTPVRPEAVAAIAAALTLAGNASSIHRAGRAARGLLRDSRDAVARAIGLPPGGTLVFTSGGTEANALALGGRAVLIGATEHESVRAAVPDATILAVDRRGLIDLDGLAVALKTAPRPALVSVMAANNETGTVQPVAAIARLVHDAGGVLHCDAVQAIGKIPFSMSACGADLVSVSAHKLGGPQGVGALGVAPGVVLEARQKGGGQERGLRAGTENLPGIAGFAAAIGPAVAELDRFAGFASLRDTLERRLTALAPETVIVGADAPRLPNTSCVALPGHGAETLLMALDLDGICVSAGAACSSGKVRASHVLTAMGYAPDIAGSALRISLGRTTTHEEIDRLAQSWAALAARLGTRRLAG